ncbi:GlcNAc-transferase family protein [Desulfonatronum thioautotrophicum]|uniref:GlcNAc-transferase family protein n=1 Tax=Desulfonatronum thioautotrophicum TaxID=617001 RepID=UPI0005EBF1DF|nr:GlcNAc-transferase family protein [Desulfonatronum thioautotrophicum]
MAQSASIFVLIASFRDPECAKTLTDMYEQAADPERVFAGICWQYDPEDPFDCMEPGLVWTQNVRVDRVPFTESEGVCWARSRAQALFRDEEYVLVIDSHMRFEPKWDQRLVAELKACPAKKSILSCYPPSFTLPLKKKYPPAIVNCAEMRPLRWPPPDERYPKGSIRGQLDFLALRRTYDTPIRGAFIAAGYSFMPADVLRNIPFDPFIDWEEEEISYSIRLWTHGWNIYAPREHLVHHLYARDRDDKGSHYFRSHISKERLVERFLRSKRRCFHLLGVIECDEPAALTDLAKYDLGQSRTLRDFEAFSGVYIRSQNVSIRAQESWFSLLSPAHYLNFKWDRLRDAYAFDYEDERVPPVPSGSRPAVTQTVRAGLMAAFAGLGVRSLLDLACGGSDWLRPEETPLDHYIGIDFIPEALGPLKEKYSAKEAIEYRLQDIRRSPLPSCDAVLARDCFTHFSYRDIVDSLRNIKNSGACYLFASHYKGVEMNLGTKAKQGAWNRLNLTLPPYCFPEPLRIIDDLPKRGKCLGVWHVNAIPEMSPNPTLRVVSNSTVWTVYDNFICFDETEYLASLRFSDQVSTREKNTVISIDIDKCSASFVFRDIIERIRTVFGLRSHKLAVYLMRFCTRNYTFKIPKTRSVVLIPLLQSKNFLSLQSYIDEKQAHEENLILYNGSAAFMHSEKCRPTDVPILLETTGRPISRMVWDFCVIEAESKIVSYATQKVLKKKALPDFVHRLVAGGDFMLSREMPGFVDSKGVDWPTRELQPYLFGADIALVNLECVISGQGNFFDKGERRPYYYRAPAEMINVLVAAGVTATTTANNHAMDFGPEALLEQSALLSRAGIAAAGGGGNIMEASRPVYLRAGDLIVAVISFATEQKRLAASVSSGGIFSVQGNTDAMDILAPVIREAKSHADLVVVSPHWGTNWREKPSENIRRLAWGIIDAGADAILGHSAHILQGVEVYSGRPIVYDMGSLLFDRVFENRLRLSALFELLFNQEGLHGLVIRPLRLEPGKVRPAAPNERGAIFRLIEGLSKELGSTAPFTRTRDTLNLRLYPAGASPRRQDPYKTFERNKVRPLPHTQRALDDANIFYTTPPEFLPDKALNFGDELTIFGARCVSQVRTGYGFLVEVYFRLRDSKGRNWRAALWAKERGTGSNFLYRHPIAEGAWLPDSPPDNRIACDRFIVRPPRSPTPGIYDLYWALVDVATSKIWKPAEKVPYTPDSPVHVGVIRFTDSAPQGVRGLVAENTEWSFAKWS